MAVIQESLVQTNIVQQAIEQSQLKQQIEFTASLYSESGVLLRMSEREEEQFNRKTRDVVQAMNSDLSHEPNHIRIAKTNEFANQRYALHQWRNSEEVVDIAPAIWINPDTIINNLKEAKSRNIHLNDDLIMLASRHPDERVRETLREILTSHVADIEVSIRIPTSFEEDLYADAGPLDLGRHDQDIKDMADIYGKIDEAVWARSAEGYVPDHFIYREWSMERNDFVYHRKIIGTLKEAKRFGIQLSDQLKTIIAMHPEEEVRNSLEENQELNSDQLVIIAQRQPEIVFNQSSQHVIDRKAWSNLDKPSREWLRERKKRETVGSIMKRNKKIEKGI